jgi:hypothetical protein
MTTYEFLSATLAGLALVVSTVVLILLVKQLRLLSQQVSDARQAIDFATAQAEIESQRRRRQATMEFISSTMSKLQDFYQRVPASGSGKHEGFLASAMVRDSEEFSSLRDYLNYLEDLSVGVNMEIFDGQVVYRSIGGRIKRAWRAYEQWVIVERRVVAPSLYTELESCATEFFRLDECR